MTIRIFSCPPVFSLVPGISILPQQLQTHSESREKIISVNEFYSLLEFHMGKISLYVYTLKMEVKLS